MTSSISDELYRTTELKKQLNACNSTSGMREGNVCEINGEKTADAIERISGELLDILRNTKDYRVLMTIRSLDMSRIPGYSFMKSIFNIAKRIDGTSTPKYDELIAEIKKIPDEKDMKIQQPVETTSSVAAAGGGIKGKSKKKKSKKSKTYKKRKGKKH
jgi:hypothetical protein